MAEQYERQTAFKLKVGEILEGKYVEEEGWTPNYLLTKGGKKVSRVNLVGVVLEKEEGAMVSLLLDDGSGKVKVRSFEEMKGSEEIGVGEGVLVVGKIRVYNQEKYISPEIIKKVSSGWLKLRALELGKETEAVEERGMVVEEKKIDEEKKEEFLDSGKEEILGVVKEIDKGEGALIEELKERLGGGVEEEIEKMLERGDIFQNMPGRVKVL